MKKTIPLVQFEEEGENRVKQIDQVRETYKRVLDIMASKIEEADIMKMFNFIMKEHPEVFVMAYDSVVTNSPTGYCKLILDNTGHQKIKLIKEVRAITGLGLKESKDLIESSLPTVISTGLSREDAADYLRRIESTGALGHIAPQTKGT